MAKVYSQMSPISIILENEKFSNYCDGFDLAEGTKRNLAKALTHYTDMLESEFGLAKKFEDLIEDADREQNEIHNLKKRSITEYVRKFPKYLEEIGMSEGTKELYANAVLQFYTREDIELPYTRIKKSNTLKSNHHIPEKEEIQNALKHASILAQAVILSQTSSGMGTAEILSLNREDFEKGFDKVTGITCFNPTRQKTNMHYWTFVTPEASRAIKLMLEERTDNDPSLFGLKNEAAILSMYRRLDEMCGNEQLRGQYRKIRSHNMRKCFNQTMREAGMPVDLVDYLSGRKETSTRAAYHDWKPIQLRAEYEKYMKHLYIQIEVVEPDRETIENLQAENRELKEQMAAMQKKNQDALLEIETLKKGSAVIEQKFSKVVDQLAESGLITIPKWEPDPDTVYTDEEVKRLKIPLPGSGPKIDINAAIKKVNAKKQ